MSNVKLNDGYSQVCVWEGTMLNPNGESQPTFEEILEFENWIRTTFGVRAQFLEQIKTKPTPGEHGTGGRIDLFFSVHKEDVGMFAVPRLQYGIRWIEDVYGNGNAYLYPKRVVGYKSW